MKSIYIRGGNKNEPGVLVLKEHLENKGHKVVRSKGDYYDVIVCFGCSTRDSGGQLRKPALNGNVNLFSKLEAFHRFQDRDILCPPFEPLGYGINIPNAIWGPFPWFARKKSHERGKDIVVCKSQADARACRDTHDFLTVYIPHTSELRAWVYKDECLAVYEKQYRDPSIDNYKNMEFRSELRDDLLSSRTLTGGAIDAVKALKMDFGAVDILKGTDGKYYTLEVNSMPDISSNIRASGIRLANRIHRWAEEQ